MCDARRSVQEMVGEHVSPRSVNALYRHAEKLNRLWAGAPLVDDFDSRMIAAVIRHMCRVNRGRSGFDVDIRDTRELCRLLSIFWSKNARRDAARRARQKTEPISDTIPARTNDLDRIHLNHLVLEIKTTLSGAGFRPDVVLAFLLSSQGWTCGEVSQLLTRRFRTHYKACTIRQWGCRTFPRIRAKLRNQPELFSGEVFS